MRRAFALLILLAGFSPALKAAPPEFLHNLEQGRNLTMVVYGTSLTEQGAWPRLFQRELHRRYRGRIHLINSAMSGQTSKWGVLNLDDRVLREKPDVILIEFAINDAHRRFELSIDDTRSNYQKMIRRIRSALPRCEIILMTMSDAKGEAEDNRQFKLAEYYRAVREIAHRNRLFLIDLYPRWTALRRADEKRYDDYMPDGLHPTDDAAEEFIVPALMEVLTEK